MQFADWLQSEPMPLAARLRKLFAGFPSDAPVLTAEARAGEHIIRQDDPCGSVCVLLEGRVTVSGIQPGYATYTFSDFDAIEFFGEYEALSGADRFFAQVQAKTRCRLLRLPASSYLQWILSDSGIMLSRVRAVMQSLLLQADRERSFLFLDSESRLLQFLTGFCTRNPAEDGEPVVVEMTRSAICEETGFCVRTINRSIRRLEQDGFLTVRRGKITVSPQQEQRMRRELALRIGR